MVKHDRGFGFIKDETSGSPFKNVSIFFHPRFVNGNKYLCSGTRVTFDVAPDNKHDGQFMAVNIDAVEISAKESI